MVKIPCTITYIQAGAGEKCSDFACPEIWRLSLSKKIFLLSSETLRKGTSGATHWLLWNSWLKAWKSWAFLFPAITRAQGSSLSFERHKDVAENKQATSTRFVFYISKWLEGVILLDTSKVFVFSERKAIPGDILCGLYSTAESSAFLFGRSASLILWQIGHLAQYSITSWLASVLSGFTSSPLTLNLLLSFSYFILFLTVPITLAWRLLLWGGARCFQLSQGQAYMKIPMVNR